MRSAATRVPATLAPAAAIAVTIGLGLYHIGSRSLWGDEAFSITLAQKPFGEFWHVVAQSQANMSLYYTLLAGWVNLGSGEAVVRILSLVAAVLAVPVVYVIALRLFDVTEAIFAVLLLAVNSFFLHYAQEARAYSLVLLLVSVATLLLVEIDGREPSLRLDAAYVVVGALALYAQFFAAFVLFAHVLALAATRRPLRRELLRLATTALLAIPLLLFVLFRDAGQVSHLQRPTVDYVRDTLHSLAGGTNPLLLVYAVGVCVAAIWVVRHAGWRRQWGMAVAFTWAAAPIISSLVISLAKPLFAPRFLIVALPGIVLVVAAGLARLPRPLAVGVVALTLALSVVQVLKTQGLPQEDFKAATQFVLENERKGDAIAFYRTSRRIPFEYYTRDRGAGVRPVSLLPTSPYGDFDLLDDYRHTDIRPSELAAIREAAARGRVWLFLSRSGSERVEDKQENRARLVAAVEAVATLRESRLFAGLDVRLYAPTGG